MSARPLALVTGAARRLGKVFAKALADEGYAVALHYWSSGEEASRTANELSLSGVPVFLLRADLTNVKDISDLFTKIDGIPHRLEAVVNSAGAFHETDPRDTQLGDWDLTMDLNVRAPFLCAKEAASRMPSGGSIINITDVGARKAWSRYAAYSASKAALEALTGILARAYAPLIRVNAIAPGLFLPSENVSEPEWQSLLDRLPMRRAGTSDELGAALLFLLHNSYVTGQTLTVDGGYGLIP